MAKILFMPAAADRDRVRKLAGVGVSEADIAAQLQIPLKRLQKRFKRELAEGIALGKTEALEKLHQMATSGSNTSATIFFVKARCGWRDTGPAPVEPQKWPPFIVRVHRASATPKPQ